VLTAISRYGARFVPSFDAIVERCRSQGALLSGPAGAEFEQAFAAYLGGGRAIATAYGRMAAYFIFKALGLPPGAQIVFPALTFWVVPEMARIAGLEVVFADVDPLTFNLAPEALERALTPRTRAVVPTHLYGLPCDMDAILAVARRRGLAVVEDCAHALGATYRAQPVGTLGDAAFFSFQVLKPLNTCGGGMAFTRDPVLADRIAAEVGRLPPPTAACVGGRLRLARLERALMQPAVFSLGVFPLLWGASLVGARLDAVLWEKVRPLHPFPPGYRERYSNVQAALGLAGLERLTEWTQRTRSNALVLDAALRDLPGVGIPPAPADRSHVYYQYPVYVPDRAATVARCLRAGLDVEYHHMDVCADLALFGGARIPAPGARRTQDALQVPVHAALDTWALERVVRRLRKSLGAADAA
jgi:dTDP-4-amino-4,6-dideoxygalactose transaminase